MQGNVFSVWRSRDVNEEQVDGIHHHAINGDDAALPACLVSGRRTLQSRHLRFE
jgi:hypothetical protein